MNTEGWQMWFQGGSREVQACKLVTLVHKFIKGTIKNRLYPRYMSKYNLGGKANVSFVAGNSAL